jgi:hypothetical protein
LAGIDGTDSGAAAEIEHAVSLYEAGPEAGEQHYFGTRALASIDLAALRLRSGALDAAADAMRPVLALPPTQRIASFGGQLGIVRSELAAPVFRGSAQARDLDERIEEFTRDSVIVGLHSLSAG